VPDTFLNTHGFPVLLPGMTASLSIMLTQAVSFRLALRGVLFETKTRHNYPGIRGYTQSLQANASAIAATDHGYFLPRLFTLANDTNTVIQHCIVCVTEQRR
jgi:hypothetical protein